jgi:hypothetical protein
MTAISISDKKLRIEIKGWDKLWALRRRLEIPVEHVTSVRADPEIAKGPKGIRLLGTYVPNVITAGVFRKQGERTFWDVHQPEKAVVIELRDEPYARIVVEVPDPPGTLTLLKSAICQGAA